MPERIQRSRAKGWSMPEGAVYVGRGTPWGNPVRVVGPDANSNWWVYYPDAPDQPLRFHSRFDANYEAVAVYRGKLRCDLALAEQAKTALRGKTLACWCSPALPCHADALLEIANA